MRRHLSDDMDNFSGESGKCAGTYGISPTGETDYYIGFYTHSNGGHLRSVLEMSICSRRDAIYIALSRRARKEPVNDSTCALLFRFSSLVDRHDDRRSK